MGKKGKPLHFKGSTFHRIIPQFMLQVWIFCLAALQAASALDSVVCIRSAREVSRNAGCVLGCNLHLLIAAGGRFHRRRGDWRRVDLRREVPGAHGLPGCSLPVVRGAQPTIKMPL